MSNYHGADHSAAGHATAETHAAAEHAAQGIRHGYDFWQIRLGFYSNRADCTRYHGHDGFGGIAVLGGITYFKKWGYLWNEWFTSVDHKKLVSCISSYL